MRHNKLFVPTPGTTRRFLLAQWRRGTVFGWEMPMNLRVRFGPNLVGLFVLVMVYHFSATYSWGEDKDENRASLTGLPGIGVQVILTDAAEKAGYSEVRLRTDVELRLRESRIRVLTRQEVLSTQGYPDLVVRLDAGEEGGVMVFSIDVSVVQAVTLVRNRTISLLEAQTWSSGAYGTVGRIKFAETIRSSVRTQVERFINAFLGVNPSGR